MSVESMLAADPLPLAVDRDGVLRVGGSRVTLDTIVGAFENGATPEEIALRYSTLNLADIYTVLGYYLRHREEISTYLQQREMAAGQVRRENEARWNPASIRERLIARQGADTP